MYSSHCPFKQLRERESGPCFSMFCLYNLMGWSSVPHVVGHLWITQMSHRCWQRTFQTFVWIWSLTYHLCTTVFISLKVLLYVALVWGTKVPKLNAFETKWIFTFSQMLCYYCDGNNVYECWNSIFVVKRCGRIRNFISFSRHSCLSAPSTILFTHIIILNNTYCRRTLAYSTCRCFF